MKSEKLLVYLSKKEKLLSKKTKRTVPLVFVSEFVVSLRAETPIIMFRLYSGGR